MNWRNGRRPGSLKLFGCGFVSDVDCCFACINFCFVLQARFCTWMIELWEEGVCKSPDVTLCG